MEDRTVHFGLHFVEQGPKYFGSNVQWHVGQLGGSVPQKRCDVPTVSVHLCQAVNNTFSQGWTVLVNSYKTWKIFCSDCLSVIVLGNDKKTLKMPPGTLRSTGGMWELGCPGSKHLAGTVQVDSISPPPLLLSLPPATSQHRCLCGLAVPSVSQETNQGKSL